MFNIHCELKLDNCFWFFHYLKHYYKNQAINLIVTCKSKMSLFLFISFCYKFKNINSVRLDITDSSISKKLCRKLKKYSYKKGMVLIFVNMINHQKDKLEIMSSFELPCIYNGIEYSDLKKVLYVGDYFSKEMFNLCCSYYKSPFVDCEYTSCALKTIFIKNKSCSVCKNIKFSNLITPENIEETFINNDTLFEPLKSIVNKRNICNNKCQYFALCKGGCFLKGDSCKKEFAQKNIDSIPTYGIQTSVVKEMKLMKELSKC